ncbi:DUF5615 family PIN-like protein [Methanothrix sp.]|uniref:DUF5615 family PIN-like protein n=1 Tax=Methanothrix sp. TaxID=90426 RepID=UPI003744974F
MRFLVDECVAPSVVRWLRENLYDAISAYEDCLGWEDQGILKKAYSERRIVVTMDCLIAGLYCFGRWSGSDESNTFKLCMDSPFFNPEHSIFSRWDDGMDW